MNYKPILIVHGEPNGILLEIFFKSLKYKKFKNPLVLICSHKILKYQMKKLRFKMDIKIIDPLLLNEIKLNNKTINVIDVKYNKNINFQKISNKSNNYIKDCFKISLKILNSGITNKLINGPISKSSFLNKKFLGITEYLTKKTRASQNAMLIYNRKLSVCPITTHLPLKFVAKSLYKKKIIKKITIIDSFYKKNLRFKPKIAVLGLNPHCETVDKFNEDERIIKPAIKYLSRKKINVKGPFSADTAFLRENRKNFDVIVGMYHDQVLSPFKSIFKFDAINITLGLKYLRVSPDHGVGVDLIRKNKANATSLLKCIKFINNLR